MQTNEKSRNSMMKMEICSYLIFGFGLLVILFLHFALLVVTLLSWSELGADQLQLVFAILF